MSTFKITVDDQSELGKHIAKFRPRERSREIYLLATIGLMTSRSSILADNLNGINVEFDKKVANSSNFGREILTSSGSGEENSESYTLNQGLGVDFGDDLLAL